MNVQKNKIMDIIYYILCICGIVKLRSKYISYTCLLMLLVLYCFSNGCADRDNYELSLELASYPTTVQYNWGYFYMMYLFSYYSMDIQMLYICVGIFYLLSIYYFIKSFSNYPNIVLSFYMIAIFLLDVVQIKNTLAMAFITWGFYFMFKINKRTKGILIYLFFVFFASLFHISALYFILYVLLPLKSRYILVISSSISILIMVAKFTLLGGFLYSLGASDKYQLESSYGEGNIFATQIILAGLIFVVYICCKLYLQKKYGV